MIKIMTVKSDLAPNPKDKRFQDPAWQYNPFMRAGMQYYLAVQKGASHWLEDLELDELERDRARFVSNIIIDSLAPTKTLIGNPSAQKMAITSGGLSLIKGLKNAYDDMVYNKGMVSQVDKKPFKLGENVATSKGSVVLRTEMMELIQYTPTTEEVYEIPQLTIPPQINKMYINDLSPEKSVVKYQLDNGIQTFVTKASRFWAGALTNYPEKFGNFTDKMSRALQNHTKYLLKLCRKALAWRPSE